MFQLRSRRNFNYRSHNIQETRNRLSGGNGSCQRDYNKYNSYNNLARNNNNSNRQKFNQTCNGTQSGGQNHGQGRNRGPNQNQNSPFFGLCGNKYFGNGLSFNMNALNYRSVKYGASNLLV